MLGLDVIQKFEQNACFTQLLEEPKCALITTSWCHWKNTSHLSDWLDRIADCYETSTNIRKRCCTIELNYDMVEMWIHVAADYCLLKTRDRLILVLLRDPCPQSSQFATLRVWFPGCVSDIIRELSICNADSSSIVVTCSCTFLPTLIWRLVVKAGFESSFAIQLWLSIDIINKYCINAVLDDIGLLSVERARSGISGLSWKGKYGVDRGDLDER